MQSRLGNPAPITLLMAVVVAAFVSQVPGIIVAGTAVCAIYALATQHRGQVGPNEVCAVAVTAILFLPAFIKTYHGLSPQFYFAATVAVFFAARAATRHPPQALLRAFQWIFGLSLMVIAYILYTYWGYPEPFGMFIEGSSTNGIPSYLIVIQIGLSLSFYLVTGGLPLLSPIATGAVAFFGNGRGSLVVASLIIVVTLLFNVIPAPGSSKKMRRYSLAALFVIAAVMLVHGAELLDLLISYTKLSVGLVDTNRLEIWDHYWGKIDGLRLLVGSDYVGTVIDYEYNNNPHIAYIRTHSLFGLPLTVLALVSPALVFLGRKTAMAKLVFGSFIGLAALRASSEPIFFPTLLDFFYFTYFFLFFRHAPSSRMKRAVHAAPAAAP